MLKIKPSLKKLKFRKLTKLILVPILLVIFTLAVFYCLPQSKKLEVDFLDVGQGDSILIKTPTGKTVLIDGGPDNSVLRRLSEVLPFYKKKIDLIIISHYHDDHTIGLVEIFKRYQAKNLIYSNYGSSSPVMKIITRLAKDKKISSLILKDAAQIELEKNCFLNLLSPEIFKVTADGNNSLLAKLNCENKKFLFTGDNSSKIEKALLNSNWNLAADVFKAAHHGSNSANSENFLRAVKPQKIVISVGQDNRFGHPNTQALKRMEQLNLKVYRTDKEGNIRFFSQ
ncbi:MAG: MBL fold metallo-hydrolase [Patescibacteria group bacterium]|jgi:beta-lactamase superfamily II metal-dependent hydrolase